MRKFTYLVPTLMAVVLLAIAGSGCTAKMKESYHLKRADRYFDSGQYDAAEIEYKNVLRNAPQNARAWSRLGVIYFDEGRVLPAAQILSWARQLATNDLNVHLKLGVIYLGAGKLKEARDEAGFVLDKYPRDDQAPILLAQAAANTNEIAETRLRLQKMSQAGETAPLAVALGMIAFRQGDLPTAAANFNRAVTLDPKFSAAYSALGSLYQAQADSKQADQAFKMAADLAPPRSGKILQYAQFKITTGDPDAGKLLLEDLVKKAPDYLPAWLALAQLAAAEKKYQDGISLLGNVLSRDPQNFDGLLLKGRLRQQHGELDQAINDFEKMARMYPRVPVVHYQLALTSFANNETNQAINSLNQALTLNPKYAEAILLLAEYQIRNGNAASAIGSLKRLIQEQPNIVPARLLLAAAYRVQGSLDTAIQTYHELENADPKNPQIPFLLGTTLLQQKKKTEARLEFDQALKLAPDYLPALEQTVNLDLMEKQYAVAQQRVQQVAGQYPKAAVWQLLLAQIQVAQGHTNQAESALLKAVELQPDSQQAYLALARFEISANQNQKALAALQTALGKNPKDTAALMLMALIYSSEKEYQKARDAYEQLLAIAPNSALPINNLASLYSENLGQLDKAFPLASQARNLAPTDPAIADTLGWILYQKGQYSSALSLLRESTDKLYAVPEVQFHLGMTYYMMEDEANARTVFQRALQLNQDFPQKKECQQYLAVLAIDSNTAGADTRVWLEKRVASQPDDAVALARLAAIYQREGNVAKAMTTYEAALQVNPQNVKAMVNLARLYASQDTPKAFALAKAANKLKPNDPQVTYLLGRLAFLTGDYQWSFNLLQLAAQAQPRNPEVLYDLGEAFYSVGRVPDARISVQNALQIGAPFSRTNDAKRFLELTGLAETPAQALGAKTQVEEILKSAPDYVPALMVKAAIAAQKSDWAMTAQTYEDVLTHYPDFAPAQKQLAILYAKDPNNSAKAYPLAVKARQAFPDDPVVAKTLGVILIQKADYGRAVSLLKECVAKNSADAEVFYYLGTAQFQLKNRAESKANLQQALKLNLSGPPSSAARQMLGELK